MHSLNTIDLVRADVAERVERAAVRRATAHERSRGRQKRTRKKLRVGVAARVARAAARVDREAARRAISA